ncbi:hypothetical protein [Parasegetibacter sp. NRK P23]|uniref:hypothetical protein n=1 Tax=Parasegetibacter sp. NRK P23 TaxID=2942999 RepID=UPI002044801B|nr:hypothetical protein [Parasegetibacter sp. NRK P23]MCM5529340.1 hypothetical protein [Parasegetibacter sp. NRK P23]
MQRIIGIFLLLAIQTTLHAQHVFKLVFTVYQAPQGDSSTIFYHPKGLNKETKPFLKARVLLGDTTGWKRQESQLLRTDSGCYGKILIPANTLRLFIHLEEPGNTGKEEFHSWPIYGADKKAVPGSWALDAFTRCDLLKRPSDPVLKSSEMLDPTSALAALDREYAIHPATFPAYVKAWARLAAMVHPETKDSIIEARLNTFPGKEMLPLAWVRNIYEVKKEILHSNTTDLVEWEQYIRLKDEN